MCDNCNNAVVERPVYKWNLLNPLALMCHRRRPLPVRPDEMTKVYKKHPGDLDAAALYAESLLVLKPWALWVRDADSGKTTPAIPSTLVAKDVLEQVNDEWAVH